MKVKFYLVYPHEFPLSRKLAKNLRVQGFTLAELLIALAVLAVIATFTIPKILQSAQNQREKAAAKETIAAIHAIFTSGVTQGEVDGSNVGDYIQNRLGYVKYCNNSFTDGCWGVNNIDIAINPGVILSNGTSLTGVQNCCGSPWYNIRLGLDINGTAPPNQMGVDQMEIQCYLPGAFNKPGLCAPWDLNGGTGSTALYQSIFQ